MGALLPPPGAGGSRGLLAPPPSRGMLAPPPGDSRPSYDASSSLKSASSAASTSSTDFGFGSVDHFGTSVAKVSDPMDAFGFPASVSTAATAPRQSNSSNLLDF